MYVTVSHIHPNLIFADRLDFYSRKQFCDTGPRSFQCCESRSFHCFQHIHQINSRDQSCKTFSLTFYRFKVESLSLIGNLWQIYYLLVRLKTCLSNSNSLLIHKYQLSLFSYNWVKQTQISLVQYRFINNIFVRKYKMNGGLRIK